MTNGWQVQSLVTYPVKSLPGMQVDHSKVDRFGLEFDRRWMLIDESGGAISQRERPELSLLQCRLNDGTFHARDQDSGNQIEIPLDQKTEGGKVLMARLWKSTREVQALGGDYDDFFSNYLNEPVRLVESHFEEASFADGNPILIIGRGSMADLNQRIGDELSIFRFRPNIIFEGGGAYDEDSWKFVRMNNVDMKTIKPCLRCVLTTVDPVTGKMGKEPLRTLNTYRRSGNGVSFGMYFKPVNAGEIRVNDKINIK